MLKTARALLVVTTLILLPVAALADPMTDWSLVGGSYSWSGGSSGLLGTNISGLTVLGDGTPLHNGALLPILGGYSSFTSGQFNGTASSWSWSGGVLNLTGCIPGVTVGLLGCNGSNNVTLLSYNFQSVQIVPTLLLGFPVPGSFDAVFRNITGTIDQGVANYFGVSNVFSTASFKTTITTSGHPGGAFSTSVNLGGTIKAGATRLPEYWGISESIGFFVVVLAAFGVMIRLRVVQPLQPEASNRA